MKLPPSRILQLLRENRYPAILKLNLGLLCNRHHHLVHREKVIVKVLPSAEMHFTWPDGTHHTTQPRGRPPKAPLPPV